MSDYFGFAGTVLVLDLAERSFRTEPLDLGAAERFLGGFGMNNVLFHAFSHPGTDPLDPDNPVILGAGPLVGTLAPGSSRVMATTKFPLTGAVAAASGSMSFGARMKWAGYDHIVILGRAASPVYVTVSRRGAAFHEASHLIGRGIHETGSLLRGRHGSSGSVIAIGPAGEALLPCAMAVTDTGGTLGRGGLGAVMGAKKLKAIYVYGEDAEDRTHLGRDAGLRIHDRKGFIEAVAELFARARRYPLHKYCIEKGMMAGWGVGLSSMFQHHLWSPEEIDSLYGQHFYEKVKKRRLACPSCFIADKDVLEWEYRGLRESSCVTSYINVALAAHVGIADPAGAAHFLKEMDSAGCDIFTFGRMVDAILRCHETGTLPLPVGSIGGPLRRDEETCSGLLDLALQKRGLGELFHMSLDDFLEFLGPAAREELVVIKGQDALYDPRVTGLGTMEFEQIVCPRGPTSATSGSPSYLPGATLETFMRHAQRMGASSEAAARILDPRYGFNVGRLTRYSEDWYTIFSSLGVCNRAMVNRFYHIEIFSRLFTAATGIETSGGELMRAADRAWTLLRVLNQREGFSRADDRIPDQWFTPKTIRGEEKRLTDYFKTRDLTRADLEGLLRDYYEERGWDPESGYPTRERLCALGLDSFLDRPAGRGPPKKRS